MIANRTLFLAAALLFFAALLPQPADASSLRYYGNGVNDIDRVKIRIDDPANNNPGPPADIGDTDFTIEFWMRAPSDNSENSAGAFGCGNNYNWINGNVVIDRDRFNQGRTFGMSLGAGRMSFSVQNASNLSWTICGSTDLRDGQWHHIAAQRRISDGFMWLYVDGQLEASVAGPLGDISYPDNGTPTNNCGGPCVNSDPFLVIGAEKHDAGAQYPSFSGWVDELRLSTSLRYSGAFTPPQQPFTDDPDTAALYHFDEGMNDAIGDSAAGGLSPGVRSFGGTPPGPEWVADTPFSASGSPGILQFSADQFSDSEASATGISVSVTRTGGASGAVSISVTSTDGTAIAGQDYQAVNTTLNWADGDATAKTLNVSLVDDAVFEGNETLSLALGGPTGGATIGTRSTAALTINDNEVASPGQVQFDSATYPVDEGAGSVTVTVNRVGGSDNAVTVNYAQSGGTATAGSDYTSSPGTLSWPDGDMTDRTFSVPIVDDPDVEGTETFNVSLSTPTGGVILGTPAAASVSITDNDVLNPGVLVLLSPTFSVGEAQPTAQIPVARTAGSDGAVSVDFDVRGLTATSPSDFDAASGTLSWGDGDATNQVITVNVNDDAEVEGDETVEIVLVGGTASGGASIGMPDVATLTITDDDTASPGVLEIASATYSVDEDAGLLAVGVTRTGGSDGAVSVEFQLTDGTALGGLDYDAPTTTTLSWADGDSLTKSFSVTILDDALVEGPEDLTIDLASPLGGATIGSVGSALVTIQDNDFLTPGAVGFTATTFSVNEAQGSVDVTVSRSGGSDGAASVDYRTVDGSASAGVDYASTTGTLSWLDGESANRAIQIAILDDMQFEGDENLAVELSNFVGAAAGSTTTASLVIVDDEIAAPGTLQFSSSSLAVSESAGTVSVAVTRIGGTDGAVSAEYSFAADTAGRDSDFRGTDGSLNWADGDAVQKTISVSIVDDASVESTESFSISLSNPGGGASVGAPDTVVVRINDNDSLSRPSGGGGGGAAGLAFALLGAVALWRVGRPARVA